MFSKHVEAMRKSLLHIIRTKVGRLFCKTKYLCMFLKAPCLGSIDLFEKTKNKRKRGQGWPVFNKDILSRIWLRSIPKTPCCLFQLQVRKRLFISYAREGSSYKVNVIKQQKMIFKQLRQFFKCHFILRDKPTHIWNTFLSKTFCSLKMQLENLKRICIF